MSAQISDTRLIVCYAYDEVRSLDIVGPLQVFATANDELSSLGRARTYENMVVADGAGPVRTSCGIRLHADMALRDLDLAGVDTLLIPGGNGMPERRKDKALHQWVRDAEERIARLGSVCSGALILAEAGVLDGRMATTHWSRCDEMTRDFPKIKMMGDRLHSYDPTGFDGDPHVFTSAGVTAGIDLALPVCWHGCRAILNRTCHLTSWRGGQG